MATESSEILQASIRKYPTLIGNWSEDRVQNALEVEKEKKLLETTGGQVATEHRKDGRKVFNTMRTMPDLGFAPEDRFMTTSKATYTPQPRIMKAPPTKLISTENFYLEVERDRHEGPANGTFGATLPAHPKAEEKMNLETTYRAQFTDTTSATARLRQTAAEPVPAAAEGEAMGTGGAPRRQRFVGGRVVPTEDTYRPIVETISGKHQYEPPVKIVPRARRGPFTRFPDESGACYGEQTWFKP